MTYRLLTLIFPAITFALTAFGSERTRAVPFELRDGDRVVLLGDTLIEREQGYGYLEEMLTVQFPDRNVTFRNLGWSGDTPEGISRAGFDFDKPGAGFEKLKEAVAVVQPTVVIIGYGMANSFEGEKGVPAFKAQMNRLLDALETTCTNRPLKFVLLSPIRHENLGAPWPDPARHNRQLSLYAKALREIAARRKCLFVSLEDLSIKGSKGPSLTLNGIHPSRFGWMRMAEVVAEGFGLQPGHWDVVIGVDGKPTSARGAQVSGVESESGTVRFTLVEDRLVQPVLLDDGGQRLETGTPPCVLRVEGLDPGKHDLRVDGAIVATASADEWQCGVVIERGPAFDQAEELRQAILRKNQLFFDRWRPQNVTYLFGFRKQEQGQNAKEIPMFDPLVADEEARIAKLRQPEKHVFEIIPITLPEKVHHEDDLEPSVVYRSGQKPAAVPPGFFEVATGLEVNLFAESPLLAKPIQMNFDPQGRLWVASSSVYPQILPGHEADDKILVLEDTDGDGFAEKSTVFADGLMIPSAVVPGDGGVYVGQSTKLLHFKDTNGDGRADQMNIVLSGFGTEDTHHMVHTLRWGVDGRLYFNQSIYIHSHFETPYGVERLNSGGIWQFRPGSQKLDVFLRGFCNPWGHDFDQFGESFVTDGAGYQGISFGVPGATYFTYASMRRELKSISPGNYPKFCGLEILRSAHFPPDWQGSAITCDFRAHRVVRFGIEERGSGYAARELGDLLRSTNVTFRPIDVKLGPDGALYVADWSNPIIQHGEVDFRDPRRDHEHGRIWRITAKGHALNERLKLIDASNRQLLDHLLSPNAYDQSQARRVLTERGPGIQDDLAAWTRTHPAEPALLQALWMYQSLDRVQPVLLEKVLAAKDGRIRAAGTRVLSDWQKRLNGSLNLLGQRVADDHPRVRLEALRGLAKIPSARAAELVLGALDKPMDDFLDYAVWLSINDLARPWIDAVKSGKWKPAGHERQLEFALKALEPSMAGEALNVVMRKREIPNDGSGPWIGLIGTAGDSSLLRRLFDQALRGGFSNAALPRALEALNQAARQRDAKPQGALDGISRLFDSPDERVRAEALRLAGAWKLNQFVPQLATAAGADSSSARVRQAAFDALREIGNKQAIIALEPLALGANRPAVQREASLTLTSIDLSNGAPAAVKVLLKTSDEKEALEFWRSLLKIKDSGPALAHALPKSDLPAAMAKSGLRAAREGGRNEPELVWALTRGANLEGDSQSLSSEELQALATRAGQEGDPGRGELIFRRKDLGCVTCHAIGGVGGKVGPDLTSIGASAQMDYLIESVLYPNRKIKEGYHSVIVETRDGMEYSGVTVREDGDQLVLRDATDKETAIAKNKIVSRSTGNSLMPNGLVDYLAPGERMDLFRFLSELGKPGPFDASRASVARSWKLLPQTLDLAQFGDDKVLKMDLSDAEWKPARSLVDGRLMKEAVAAALEGAENRDPKAIYAATRLQATTSGPIMLKMTGASGVPAWIDGKPVAFKSDVTVDLEAGTHTVVLKLERNNLPESIRLESPGATFLPD